MNQNIKTFLLCPIPEEQKPINEYIQFKENTFINWTVGPLNTYIKNLISFFLKIFFTFCLFSSSQLFEEKISSLYLFNWIFQNFIQSFFILFISLVIVLFQWINLNQKLKQALIFYEEASWYDGQSWEKPFFLIKNDKLISSQKVEPLIKRLLITIFFIFLLLTLLVFE